MILFKKAIDLRKWLDTQQGKGKTIGFVPTMGALHAGHVSLIDASEKQANLTVSSIFINPTQFNDRRDFEKYPVTLSKDIDMLEEAGCDVLFLPSVKEMYPDGITRDQSKTYDLEYLETILEGNYRPGHFQGVCQVVHRLLDIVRPHFLYLGQKDYQQCMVIKKLISLIGMEGSVELVVCPTLREADGLAMSSRNMRLNAEERKKAVSISKALYMIKYDIKEGNLEPLKQKAKVYLEENGFKVDYVGIADANDLSSVKVWDGKQKLVALIAAYLNEVRLIDNMILT